MKYPGKVYWNVLHSNLPNIWKMFATVLVLRDGFKFEICKVGKSLSTSILTSEALLLHASYIWTEKILGNFWTMTTNNFCSFCYKIECFEIREQFPRFVSLIFWQYSTSVSVPVSQICRHKIFDIEFLNSPSPAKLKTICSENENVSRIILLWNVALKK